MLGGSGSDDLSGGEGNDYLSAGKGDDLLEGGAGRDKLVGGGGADVFIFDASVSETGNDRLYDFSEEDTLLFSGFEFSSYDELMEAVTQDGNDVVMALSESSSLTLHNYSVSNLNADDFVFA